MRTTTISLSKEAYRLLKAQKKEGESFSDLIIRKFGKGNPDAILAYLKAKGPNVNLADSVERVNKELQRNLKMERAEP